MHSAKGGLGSRVVAAGASSRLMAVETESIRRHIAGLVATIQDHTALFPDFRAPRRALALDPSCPSSVV